MQREMQYIFSLDPGNIETAYVLARKDDLKPLAFAKALNKDVVEFMRSDIRVLQSDLVIERVASYGMAVGATVFQTCEWIGRFSQVLEDLTGNEINYVYRKDEKIVLCNSMKAKDSNIRQALIDLYGEVGTKNNQGWFYGFKKDIWSAYAVAHTFRELEKEKKNGTISKN